MPGPTEIARKLKVDQPFVSNARNGRLTIITRRVERLYGYASMLVSTTRPVARSDVLEDATSGDGEVIELCRRYIADGYDAKVLTDQVALLRRAQARP